jgi:hypothetical protein
MLEKYHDEEQATIAVLARKEKQLDSILFLGAPALSKVVKKNTRGPMDAFLTRGI